MSTMALNFMSKNGLRGLAGNQQEGSPDQPIACGLVYPVHYVL